MPLLKQLRYRKAPDDGRSNLPPSEGMQFFGQVDIDGDSAERTVRLEDLEGTTLHTRRLVPESAPKGSA